MPGLFKSILIPVDFSSNTETAVNQAIELACTDRPTIHLLHVIKSKGIWGLASGNKPCQSEQNKNSYPEKMVNKLRVWKLAIEESVPEGKVFTYLAKGGVYTKIRHAARELKPDLIILGKNNSHKCFPLFHSVCPNGLAKRTGYPVLTVMKKPGVTKIKIIVFPVGSFIPDRKIELAIEFAKKYRAAIHLVTIPNKIHMEEGNGNPFLETYRILRTGLTTSVEHHILNGNNFPKTILEYAECVGADLILVNPGSETRINHLTGMHINDALTTSSRLKVLSIHPHLNNGLSVV